MSTLKDRLKEARAERGLSQAALAKALGLGQTTIASIENGRNQSSGALVQIAEYLGVSPTWLADGTGPKKNHAPSWPFRAPFEAYERLSEARKDALDTIVSAFLAGNAADEQHFQGQPQYPQRSAQTHNLSQSLDKELQDLEEMARDGRAEGRPQRRRSK